jgi:enoyl-CoA hydratase
MDSPLVRYTLEEGIATIAMDDGKRNALSPQMLQQLNAALDRARADRATIVLTGRETVFSAGFDLAVLKRGGANALSMMRSGFSMTARLMSHPHPVVAACNGHSLAMGVFLMLSCDYIIGARGDYRISANEVALGLQMPRVAAALLRHRLTPAAFQCAVTLSRDFPTELALHAGLLDEAVEPALLQGRARQHAVTLSRLDQQAHAASKLRIRRTVIRQVRAAIPLDLIDAARVGLRSRTHQSRSNA